MTVLTYMEYWFATAIGIGCVLAVISFVALAWMWVIGKGRS